MGVDKVSPSSRTDLDSIMLLIARGSREKVNSVFFQ